MADPRQLSEREVEDLLLQVAAASDFARASGLELAGEVARIRSEQAEIEAARLRFKHGADAPAAAMATSAARMRGERAATATAGGEKARKDIRALLKKGREIGSKPPRKDEGFTVRGKVMAQGKAVPGLIVEARTGTPVTTVARGKSGDKGEFELGIAEVRKLKREIHRRADEPLVLTLVAFEGRRIVARSKAFEAEPGTKVTANLEIGQMTAAAH